MREDSPELLNTDLISKTDSNSSLGQITELPYLSVSICQTGITPVTATKDAVKIN